MNNLSRCLLLFLVLLTGTFTFAQTGDFNHPWTDPTTAIVLDPFEGNSINWNKVATDTRVVAVIHRGTIGSRKALYKARRDEAKSRGYKWGSYHLGKPGDPNPEAGVTCVRAILGILPLMCDSPRKPYVNESHMA